MEMKNSNCLNENLYIYYCFFSHLKADIHLNNTRTIHFLPHRKHNAFPLQMANVAGGK